MAGGGDCDPVEEDPERGLSRMKGRKAAFVLPPKSRDRQVLLLRMEPDVLLR